LRAFRAVEEHLEASMLFQEHLGGFRTV